MIMANIQPGAARRGFEERYERVDQGYQHIDPHIAHKGKKATIDVSSIHPTEANGAIKEALALGATDLSIIGVNGQRFIGAGIVNDDVAIVLDGVPGNDLGMLAEGPTIRVNANAQDGVGNTMASGTIFIDGHAGDVLGYAMRGGSIFVHGDIGYRAGINMKEFKEHHPVIVVGGKTRDFLGEYMAGGTIVVLGMNSTIKGSLVGDFTGAGMCAGTILVRGEVEPWTCGKGLDVEPATEDDLARIRPFIERYAQAFGEDATEILNASFTRISPCDARPYRNLYAPL